MDKEENVIHVECNLLPIKQLEIDRIVIMI